jgi:hypothetical protein
MAAKGTIAFRASPLLREAIEFVATEDEVTASGVIRQALLEYLKARGILTPGTFRGPVAS